MKNPLNQQAVDYSLFPDSHNLQKAFPVKFVSTIITVYRPIDWDQILIPIAEHTIRPRRSDPASATEFKFSFLITKGRS